MNHPAFLPAPERPDNKSLLLSAAVHLLLLAALFFGVQWKSKAPTAVEVEVWRAAAPSTVAPPPRPEPPPPPKPEPKPEPKIEPTPLAKPDIAIKDEKKKKEEPKKPEKPEPRKEEARKPEPKKPEPKREEPDWKKELANEQKQIEQQKAIQDQQAKAAAEASQLARIKADQAAAGRAAGLADYVSKIRGKVRGNIVLPPSIQGNPEAILEITQLPSGEIINVRIRKSSGNRLLDEAIERAIRKSDPLPTPDKPELFQRILELKYRPLDE